MSKRHLIENYLTFLPTLYKSIFKDLPNCEITKLQMEFLYYLKTDGGMPMNYYGKKIMVSKSNMSVLAEKMIDEGYVKRGTLENDRRVTTLSLTKRGGALIDEEITKFTNHLLDKLSVFNNYEIERLNEIIKEVKNLFSKIENED